MVEVRRYREIADEVLAQIAQGEVRERFRYSRLEQRYRLEMPVREILGVEGVSGGVRRSFVEGRDFRLVDNHVEWISGGERPDHNSEFTVVYRYAWPSGLTDVRPGSVVRNIVEAISREIERLYLELREAYYSGFLDTAEGRALDLVVALLGVERKPPQHATGRVTFGRRSEPEGFRVEGEVHLYDGREFYRLKNDLVKGVLKVEGVVDGQPYVFEEGTDYRVSGSGIVWLQGGKRPDLRTVFRVDYEAYRKIVVPVGTKVASSAASPEEVRVYVTTEEDYLKPTAEGTWEADIPVRCTVPGSWGNVLAGTLTVMPRPPMGVEYAINKEDIYSGVDEESDEELRERARRALEYAGRATLSSLVAAVRAVEGVRAVRVEEAPDGVYGLVRVIVDGGDMGRILEAVDSTRAAGIKVEVVRPVIVYIDLNVDVVLNPDAEPGVVVRTVEERLRTYMSGLDIGEPVLFSRMVEAALCEGVWDVNRIVARITRGAKAEVIENGTVPIGVGERASPRNIAVLYRVRAVE